MQRSFDSSTNPHQNYTLQDLDVGREVSKEMEKVLETLFKQERELERMPFELTQAAERKRRKKLKQRHI